MNQTTLTMENEYSKHLIYGNYRSMPGQDFPMDCETLAAMQNNIQKLAVIASVAGCDRLVLTGCEVQGNARTDGYVFVRSAENPDTGEILYHPQQPTSEYCHIAETDIDVTANTIEYPNAYTQRYLASGNGNGAMLWTSFKTLGEMSLSALLSAIRKEADDREAAIQQVKDDSSVKFVRGMIIMWSGEGEKTIPSGWALCDGKTYQIDGETVKTPDLRDKFVMGAKYETSGSDELGTFLNVGTTGGEASVTLTVEQMPTHSHSGTTGSGLTSLPDLHKPLNTTGWPQNCEATGNGSNNGNGKEAYWRGNGDIARFSHTHSLTTANAGGGQAHENRPPYYVLAFIMKL